MSLRSCINWLTNLKRGPSGSRSAQDPRRRPDLRHRQPSLSIRVDLPNGRRFGPGKADLLAAIAAAGSVSGAARALGMSYPRALRLVEDMNTLFAAPLVETFHGGKSRGGARLTAGGESVLACYRELEQTLAREGAALLDAFGPETDPETGPESGPDP